MYINDLLDGTESDCVLYADDTKIHRFIMNKSDAYRLQSDIDKLEIWSIKWLMNFHPGKCHALALGKFENIQYVHLYKVCNQDIEQVNVEKYLGVHIDEGLTFEEQPHLHQSSYRQRFNWWYPPRFYVSGWTNFEDAVHVNG